MLEELGTERKHRAAGCSVTKLLLREVTVVWSARVSLCRLLPLSCILTRPKLFVGLRKPGMWIGRHMEFFTECRKH